MIPQRGRALQRRAAAVAVARGHRMRWQWVQNADGFPRCGAAVVCDPDPPANGIKWR